MSNLELGTGVEISVTDTVSLEGNAWINLNNQVFHEHNEREKGEKEKGEKEKWRTGEKKGIRKIERDSKKLIIHC